jgi:hypothetical protein
MSSRGASRISDYGRNIVEYYTGQNKKSCIFIINDNMFSR